MTSSYQKYSDIILYIFLNTNFVQRDVCGYLMSLATKWLQKSWKHRENQYFQKI